MLSKRWVFGQGSSFSACRRHCFPVHAPDHKCIFVSQYIYGSLVTVSISRPMRLCVCVFRSRAEGWSGARVVQLFSQRCWTDCMCVRSLFPSRVVTQGPASVTEAEGGGLIRGHVLLGSGERECERKKEGKGVKKESRIEREPERETDSGNKHMLLGVRRRSVWVGVCVCISVGEVTARHITSPGVSTGDVTPKCKQMQP